MSRFREPAMIEPEPTRRARRKGEPGSGRLPFFFGLVVGLGGMAVWLAYPEIWDGLVEFYEAQLQAVPEDKRALAPYGVMGIAAIVLYAVRRPLLKSAFPIGALIGIALWVPLGRHFLGLVPQIDEAMPTLRPGLEELVGSSDALTQVAGLVERYIPVPGGGAN